MVNRYLLEQVFSYFGLVFWSLQLAPQAWKTYRRGTSTGVSVWTMFIWTFAGLFMGVYNIGLNVALALWIQPQLFTFIALICLMQEFRYQHQWSKTKTAAGFVVCCLVIGALEAGFIFAFRRATLMENEGGIRFFGIIPVIFVLGGFLPQYYEIFRDRRVIGVSRVFLAMDFSGSIFSTLALAYSASMDALNLANYVAIAVLDVGIFSLYYILEWYQAKYNPNQDQVSSSSGGEEGEKETAKQLSYDCEDARNTKSLA